MKIFVTTDTHFGHEKLTEIGVRPLGFSELLLKNLANKQGDLIFHLGDFCVGNDADWLKMYMIATKKFSRRILVRGNHDNKSDHYYYKNGFDFVCNKAIIKHFQQEFIFSHEPYWDFLNGKINVHGHLHGNAHRNNELPVGYNKKMYYDCAPERHNYHPVALLDIFNAVKKSISAEGTTTLPIHR